MFKKRKKRFGGWIDKLLSTPLATLLGVTAAVAVALAAVGRTGVARSVIRGSQLLIEDEAASLHKRDSRLHGHLHRLVVVARRVMDETSSHTLTELGVLPRIHKEGVPTDVHPPRRRETLLREVRAELEEAEGLVHDGLGFLARLPLVLQNAPDETLPELLVDKLLMPEIRQGAGLHFNFSFPKGNKTF